MLNDFGCGDRAKLERHFQPEPARLPGKEPRREQIACAGSVDQSFDRFGRNAGVLLARHCDRTFFLTRNHQGRNLGRDHRDGGIEIGLARQFNDLGFIGE